MNGSAMKLSQHRLSENVTKKAGFYQVKNKLVRPMTNIGEHPTGILITLGKADVAIKTGAAGPVYVCYVSESTTDFLRRI